MRYGTRKRAPSPHPNSGLPEFGILSWSKSDISDFDWGEGWVRGFVTLVSL
jgi:hypothetical protein